MKTSNKLLITATIIIIGYLVAYDFSLKAEYIKGDYKSRFYNMKRIPVSGFDAIENNAANFTDLTIEQGPEYGIWINERIKDKVVITKNNKTLLINYKADNGFTYRHHMIITCPDLRSIITRPEFVQGEQAAGAETQVTGFNQDMMTIQAANGTSIALVHNNINKLNAGTTDSKATLTIHGENTIKDASFNILGRSELKLLNPAIAKSHFNYTDSTTMTLSGRALHILSLQ